MTQQRLTAEHHIRSNLAVEPCFECQHVTLWKCMDCCKPLCLSCSYSQFSLCRACKAVFVGPLWQLGKRADEYIKAEFERVFQC